MAFILTYRRPQVAYIPSLLESRGTLRGRRRSVSVSDNPKSSLLSWEALPDWYRENPFILSGYRQISRSSLACLYSICSLHNETLNIYTHLIPAIVLGFSLFSVRGVINYNFPEASALDHFVFICNVAAAIITLSLSSLYHTLHNHSKHISHLWLRIDYVGILTLILASFFSGIYVGFYSEPLLRTLYWSMIVSLSLVAAVLVLHPQLQGLRYRTLRTWAFISTALSGFAPIFHGLYLYGWDQMLLRSGMPYYFLEGIIYGLGAFFFVTHIPESLKPGTFDIWLSSHQIFHVLVVLGSLVHMYGVWQAYTWNYQNQHICLVPN